MNFEVILKMICVVVGILLIIAIALQPSQKSGLIGDVNDSERVERRDEQLFFFRFTIIGIIVLFAAALLFGMGIGGAF